MLLIVDLCLEVHENCGGILLIFMCKICMHVCVGVVGEAKKNNNMQNEIKNL